MELFSQLNPLAVAALSFAVIGFVKFADSLYKKDYQSAYKIAVAGLIGSVLAPFAGDLTWFQGLLIGLNGSGIITTVSYFGSK